MDVFAIGIRTGVLQDPSPYSTIFSDPFSDTLTIVNKLKDSQKATKKQGKKKIYVQPQINYFTAKQNRYGFFSSFIPIQQNILRPT